MLGLCWYVQRRAEREAGDPGWLTRSPIYRRLLAAQVRGHAAYRASFALDLAGNALIPAVDLIAVVAMFRVTRTLGGFTAAEVLVMFGLSASAFALADLAVGNIERIRCTCGGPARRRPGAAAVRARAAARARLHHPPGDPAVLRR